MFFLKKALLAKIEGTYGTDPTPTGAANAILARNVNITPMEQTLNDRAVAVPWLGHMGQVPGSSVVKIEFEVEVAGAGAAGTVPPYGVLLRACGYAETTNVGVSVVYAPVSAAFESATLYFNLDGALHKLTGARGDVGFMFDHEQVPVYKFSFTGIWNAPTDTALPNPFTLTAWQAPLAMNKVNTPTFTLHAVAAILAKLELNGNQAVQHKAYVNAEQVRQTDRKLQGSITIEAPAIATKDWWTAAKSAATGALQLVHGTAAGNIVQFDAPKVQLTSPNYEDADGVAMLAMSAIAQPNAGNDEVTVTVK